MMDERLKKLAEPIDFERMEQLATLVVKTAKSVDEIELVVGYLRYEALRKLNPRQFTELHMRNLKGENFDEMINELIIKGEK